MRKSLLTSAIEKAYLKQFPWLSLNQLDEKATVCVLETTAFG